MAHGRLWKSSLVGARPSLKGTTMTTATTTMGIIMGKGGMGTTVTALVTALVEKMMETTPMATATMVTVMLRLLRTTITTTTPLKTMVKIIAIQGGKRMAEDEKRTTRISSNKRMTPLVREKGVGGRQ